MSAGMVMQDSRLKTGRTGTRWRPIWGWGKETETFMREVLRDAPRPIVHVGCGSSRVGDLRLDFSHPGADMLADSRELPLADGSVGTVICDPPWTVAGLQDREKWVQEAKRVLRVGGLYVVHAPWAPARPTLEFVAGYLRDDSMFNGFPRSPILLTVWRKLSNGTRRRPVGNQEAT
jgi:hypothetical protein